MVDFSPEDSAQDLDVLNLNWFHDQGIPENIWPEGGLVSLLVRVTMSWLSFWWRLALPFKENKIGLFSNFEASNSISQT